MRVKVTLTFNASGRAWSSMREVLLAAGQAESAEPGDNPLDLHSVSLWDDDPELAQVQGELRQRRIDWFESRTLVFTEDELTGAPLLRLIVRRTPKGVGGSTSYGNEYDLSSVCPSCGTGARRTSPLRLRRSELPKRGDMVETGAGEILVSPELAQLLEAERVTGLDLDQVCDQRTGEPLPWVHLRSAHHMPPAGATTTGGAKERPCPVCDRDGHYDSANRPLQIGYERAALASAPDVAHTWECFGRSWLEPPTDQYVPGARIAQPLVLVKPRVRSLLLREKVRLLDFEPVRTG